MCIRDSPETDRITEKDLSRAAEMINQSKKPFLFVGGGTVISGASEEVRALAHKIQAPVCDSLMGKGAFPGDDRLYTGMLGMHGTKMCLRDRPYPLKQPENHNAIAYLGKVAYTVSVGLVYFIMGIMRLEMDDEENGQISYFKN